MGANGGREHQSVRDSSRSTLHCSASTRIEPLAVSAAILASRLPRGAGERVSKVRRPVGNICTRVHGVPSRSTLPRLATGMGGGVGCRQSCAANTQTCALLGTCALRSTSGKPATSARSYARRTRSPIAMERSISANRVPTDVAGARMGQPRLALLQSGQSATNIFATSQGRTRTASTSIARVDAEPGNPHAVAQGNQGRRSPAHPSLHSCMVCSTGTRWPSVNNPGRVIKAISEVLPSTDQFDQDSIHPVEYLMLCLVKSEKLN